MFGTETRGVELPIVKPDFQTNVPGLSIAGELGGMGLIRNAIERGSPGDGIDQGPVRWRGATDMLDGVIVGAGPAAFSGKRIGEGTGN